MLMKHKEKGYLIKVQDRNGKIFVGKDGLAIITSNTYKGFNKVDPMIITEKFDTIQDRRIAS